MPKMIMRLCGRVREWFLGYEEDCLRSLVLVDVESYRVHQVNNDTKVILQITGAYVR